jgi:hypothetical protein
MKLHINIKMYIVYVVLTIILVITSGCDDSFPTTSYIPVNRVQSIPATAVKMSPSSYTIPPILHSDEFQDPVPLGSGINTAGAEDSPFILPDGNTLYFFFTPDGNIPAEKQLFDGVTGIWSSSKVNGEWTEAQRIFLQREGEPALDGAECVVGDEMWFASARQGNKRNIDIWTAQFKSGKWTDWKNTGELLNVQYEVGELHITLDGSEMYFHSPRAGGKGNYDIWVTRLVDGKWQTPENVSEVNTTDMDGWPCITPDGQELWLTRPYMGTSAIYRAKKVNGKWSEPELILSQFAGEPTLDYMGNLYFVHHFFKDNRMIEADIYVAYRK